MRLQTIKKNKGFTLVEALFAVLILTFTITGLMTIVANSLFSARYAKDEITVNYLLQEVIDYVRNDRDVTVFIKGDTWDNFVKKYDNCLTTDGCYFDVLDNPVEIKSCKDSVNGVCPTLYYDESAKNSAFYINDDGSGMVGKTKTNFQRKIVVTRNISDDNDEILVTVTMNWKNGSVVVNRSLSTTLTNWQ